MRKKLSTMKFLYLGLLIIVSLFIFVPNVSAQVVINEVLPDPSGEETQEEWVELFNKGSEEVDVEGFVLKDAANHDLTINSSHVDGSTQIPANSWLLIKRNGHSTFSLNNTNDETIKLYDQEVNLLDTFTYTDSTTDKSWGRIPDGGGINSEELNPTPGGANETPPTPTPEPTPTLTFSPTPTSTPIPTLTPTPKPTVKAIVTKKPKVISTKTTSDEEESEVLGLREGLEPPSPTPVPESEEKGKIPVTAILFVLGGLGFMGVAGYPFLKSMKKRYNIENEEKETAEGDFKPGDS